MSNGTSPFGARREAALDRAIDRAVRRMTQLDPRPGLRGRVLSRIQAAPGKRGLLPRIAFATAAVAVVLLAFVMTRRDPAPANVEPRPAAVAQAAPETAPPSPSMEENVRVAPQPPRRTPGTRIRPAPHRERIVMPEIVDVFGARDPRMAAAAASVPEDTVFPRSDEPEQSGASAAADDQAMTIAPISVAPLRVESLQVDPLTVRK
jgi:hypothetical protein